MRRDKLKPGRWAEGIGLDLPRFDRERGRWPAQARTKRTSWTGGPFVDRSGIPCGSSNDSLGRQTWAEAGSRLVRRGGHELLSARGAGKVGRCRWARRQRGRNSEVFAAGPAVRPKPKP